MAVNYGDYALWQRQQLSGQSLARLTDFWRRNLAGIETLVLPLDRPRPRTFDHFGCDHQFSIDAQTSAQLRQLAKSCQTTLHNVMLAGFYVLLNKFSGQSQIVIGTPSDNREQASTLHMIGLFTNMLALPMALSSHMSVAELIADVHQNLARAKAHQGLPFEQLVDALSVSRDSSKHPIFQVMFTLINSEQSNQALAAAPFDRQVDDRLAQIYQPAKFDLSVFVDEAHQKLSGHFNYATSLFDDSTIARLCACTQADGAKR